MSFKEWRIISFEESGLEIEDGDRGKNYPKKNELLDKGYCPFLNNKNLIGDEINFNEVDFITKEKDEVLRKGRVRINDIILTNYLVGISNDEFNLGESQCLLNYKILEDICLKD